MNFYEAIVKSKKLHTEEEFDVNASKQIEKKTKRAIGFAVQRRSIL